MSRLDENDWQTILAAVENLRGGGTQPHDTDTRWRIARQLADIASRLRRQLDEQPVETETRLLTDSGNQPTDSGQAP